MTFLSPGLLYGLGALLVPIVIHLWQRKRVIKVPFSTLRFLKIVAARTSRSARLENLLLLLLRCLVLALLVLAAARPVGSKDSRRLLGGGDVPRTVALVLDESLSMAYQSGEVSRLDWAKRQAAAVIDDLKPGDEIVVVAVSDRARVIVGEPTVDHLTARKAIEAILPTEARTDFSLGLKEAVRALSKSSRGGDKQIFLFSDNQANGWRFEKASVFDDAWRACGAKLVVVRPDELSAGNASVSRIRFDAPFATSGLMSRGAVTVENHSATTLRDLLEIRLGADKVATQAVEVPPGSSIEVRFEFLCPTIFGRWSAGVASLAGDHLPADDRCYFTLGVYQTPRVLVVEPPALGPEKSRPAFYLRKALAAGAQGAPIRSVSVADLDELPLEAFSAVFLTGVADVSDRASVRLSRYLEAGGTVVFFPGDASDLGALSRLDWMPAKPQKIRELPAGRLVTRAIDPRHPLFVNSWDANTPFPALPQRRILDWKLGADAQVLLTLGDDFPFLIFAQRGAGRVLLINASADRAWGDFPLTSAYLPLVQQIGRLSMTRAGKEASYFVGDRVGAPSSLPRDQALNLKLPDGEMASVPAGAALLERAERAGVYEVSSTSEGPLHAFAVNIDPKESDLLPIAPEALKEIVPHESVAGLDALRLWLTQSRGLVPLWPLFLMAALAAFAIESVYSNLLAGRRSQTDSHSIRTGRLNARRMGQPFRAPETNEPTEVPAGEGAP